VETEVDAGCVEVAVTVTVSAVSSQAVVTGALFVSPL
jgi:hypothetical protein